MRLKYLGTAAAEAFPALFCSCEQCKAARKLGGKNIRSRSQAVIDDKFLIDLPADTYMHIVMHSLKLEKMQHCIITHSHSDHLYVNEFSSRAENCSTVRAFDGPFKVYSSEGVRNSIMKSIDIRLLEKDIELNVLQPYKCYTISDYTVTPLKASHDPESHPYIYIIEKDSKTLMYGNDTGYFPNETWDHLKELDKKFDFVSLDCTFGLIHSDYYGHMTVELCVETKERMRKMGCVDDDTVFCLNHFSHNAGNGLYDELSELVKQYGFIVSYDGMECEI